MCCGGLASANSGNVSPYTDVYPILAFLAGTYPGGTNPPWIVNGSYDLEDRSGRMRLPLSLRGELGNGPLRSNLAAPSLQQWLPDTMVAFAKQTGAGGFSFDYTYFEWNNHYNQWTQDQYAQWTGWRKILHRLHTAKAGKACGGDHSSCVVDNRQQNHKWGPWMWVQVSTSAVSQCQFTLPIPIAVSGLC